MTDLSDVNGVNAAQLLSFIERVERIEEEKKALQNDIKEIFDEAKYANYDVKAIKVILKKRKGDPQEQEQFDFIVATYERALGM